MLNLWNERQSTHQRQMFKYLRYVFNDHFVLALLFIFGGLGLGYSNYLKSLPLHADYFYAKPLVALILVVTLQVGNLATLLKSADIVFISPKQAEMPSYLNKAFNHSLLFAWGFDILVMLCLAPFLLYATTFTSIQLIYLGLVVLSLKYLLLKRQYLALYQHKFAQLSYKLLLDVFFSLLICLGALYFNGLYFVLITAALGIYVERMVKQIQTQEVFLWEVAIANEQARMLVLYRFFNLFTDVPFLQAAAKRRKYLDRFLPRPKPKYPYHYLYWRALVRNGEYSDLIIRLNLLGAIILYFVHEPWLAFLVSILFIYMLGFQLMALYRHFDEIVFTHLYPVTEKQKLQAFQRVLQVTLGISALLFAVINSLQTNTWLLGGEIAVVLFLEIIGLTGPYLKSRLGKRA